MQLNVFPLCSASEFPVNVSIEIRREASREISRALGTLKLFDFSVGNLSKIEFLQTVNASEEAARSIQHGHLLHCVTHLDHKWVSVDFAEQPGSGPKSQGGRNLCP